MIKKQTKQDKINWINELTKETKEDNEIWEGMKTIANGYKPTRFAKRDRHGVLVNQDQRAEATKDYLEKEHWGQEANTTTTTTEQEQQEKALLREKCEKTIK